MVMATQIQTNAPSAKRCMQFNIGFQYAFTTPLLFKVGLNATTSNALHSHPHHSRWQIRKQTGRQTQHQTIKQPVCSTQRNEAPEARQVSKSERKAPKPLPKSSENALQAAYALVALALGIPLALALQESSTSTHTLMMHLQLYTSHFEIIAFSLGFATLHSGLASLRAAVTPVMGERAYRVLFALASLPSAAAFIAFFIAHRYDGPQLLARVFGGSLQAYPMTHAVVYGMTFISFLFLYPATFNLLEVAAVQKPTFRMYEKGITRITRHPQLFGQVLWCVAHTAWIGSSFTLVASLCLVAHHCFGAWNGDRRLRDAYGDAWFEYAARTSIVPFAAILDGSQQFDWREFCTPAYVGVVLATLGFYAAHPRMLAAVHQLHL